MEGTQSQPLVSAIVSTYNSERFIRGCIEDLESQTIAHQLEIIVIDSASPQNEGEIVRELQELYGNIRYLRTERRETVYAAWNRGIALARGRYITNANTDDRHRRDALELMARVMDDRPAVDLVYADVLITRTPNETFEHHTPNGRYSWYDWDRNILMDKTFIGPQPMWRRSLHELYGGFDPSYVTSGDYEFWLRISQTSDFFHIRQPLGLYLAHPDSIEHQNEESKYRENSKIRELYHHAASEGRIFGLLPFQQMRSLTADGSSTVPITALIPLINMIEDRLIPAAALTGNQMENYLLIRSGFLGRAEAEALQIEEFLQCLEKLVIDSNEWYANRRSVEGTATDDALMRLQVLSEAILKGRLFFQRGEVDSAVSTLLEQGISAAPASPAAYFELADILMAAGRHEDALQVLPEMPQSADVSRQQEVQAICYAALGQDDAARQAACQVVGRPRPLVVLGTLAARNGNLAEAEQMFRRAIEADQFCGSAWLSLGMLQWGNEDHDGAYQAVLRSVVVEPLNNEAVRIMRDMAARNHRNAEALRAVSSAVQLYPDSRNLSRHYAELLALCHREREALATCEAFLVKFGVDEDLLSLALQLRSQIGSYDRLAATGTQAISLCMIVKNEEKNVPACLSSLKPVVDEIIVVDTGSTDRTVDMATIFGARVLSFAWNGNFSTARNFALTAARGNWILVMDADEVLAEQDYELLRQSVREGGGHKICWNVLTRNYTRLHPQGWIANDGSYRHEERAEGWHPSRKVRLFPRDKRIVFQGEVHEMVDTAAEQAGYRVKEAPFVVHHYGALEERSWGPTPKQLAYFELGLQKLTEHPEDVAAIGELAVQAAEIGRYDAAVSLWDRFLALRPDAVIALFNKGFVLMSLHRYAEALIVSKRALELDPNHREAAFNYGMCELYAGDPELALKRVRPVAGRNPEHPLLQALFAVLCFVCNTGTEGREKMSMLKESGFKIEAYIAERASALDACGRENMAAGLRQESGINL